MSEDEIKQLSLDYQYVPDKGVSGYLKVELIKAHTTVDGWQNREMVWHRYSFCDSVSGDFEILFETPFGLNSVSG